MGLLKEMSPYEKKSVLTFAWYLPIPVSYVDPFDQDLELHLQNIN